MKGQNAGWKGSLYIFLVQGRLDTGPDPPSVLCPASLGVSWAWRWSWGFRRASHPHAPPNIHPQPPKVQLVTFPPVSGFGFRFGLGFGFFFTSAFGHTRCSKGLKPCCTSTGGAQCSVTSPFHAFICIPPGWDFRALLKIKSRSLNTKAAPHPTACLLFHFRCWKEEALSSWKWCCCIQMLWENLSQESTVFIPAPGCARPVSECQEIGRKGRGRKEKKIQTDLRKPGCKGSSSFYCQ